MGRLSPKKRVFVTSVILQGNHEFSLAISYPLTSTIFPHPPPSVFHPVRVPRQSPTAFHPVRVPRQSPSVFHPVRATRQSPSALHLVRATHQFSAETIESNRPEQDQSIYSNVGSPLGQNHPLPDQLNNRHAGSPRQSALHLVRATRQSPGRIPGWQSPFTRPVD